MSPQPQPLATTTTPADKPNPSYFKSAPVSQDRIQQKQVLLHLYAYQYTQGNPNANQTVIVDPKLPACFGTIAANDWTIYDGPANNPGANIVARAQGLHVGAQMAKESWFICFNMVFVDERFTGSSFKVMGDFEPAQGEWTIVGGTGEFACAQGVITYKSSKLATGKVRELHVRALCLSFSEQPVTTSPSKPPATTSASKPPDETPSSKTQEQRSVTKIGPWGTGSGKFLDVPATPQRLESLMIRHGVVIDSLTFSFIDQAGEKHTLGRWGGPRGDNKDTIEFAPSEIVTEISGTLGIFGEDNVQYNAIASLTIVTNVKKYGPFGIPQATSFNVPVQDNNSIVGFFARAGKYVEAIGVYVRPPLSN